MSIVLFIILSLAALGVVYGLNRGIRGRVPPNVTDPSGQNMAFSAIIIFVMNLFARSAETDSTRFLIFAGLLIILVAVNWDTIGIIYHRDRYH